MDAGTTTFNDQMRENAEKSTGMGGKRFLGWTPNGAEAWISYNVAIEELLTTSLTLLNTDYINLATGELTLTVFILVFFFFYVSVAKIVEFHRPHTRCSKHKERTVEIDCTSTGTLADVVLRFA